MAAGTEIGPGGRGRGRLFTPLHCHHQNDSCTLMGSDERYFNVSLTVRAKSRDSVDDESMLNVLRCQLTY